MAACCSRAMQRTWSVPFGARGANSGVQDTDNLVWKLDLVMRGLAPDSLLDTYDDERIAAADENILNSTRATDFITPKSAVSRTFRDAVLSARPQASVRPAAGEQRTPVGARDPRRLPPQHAGRRRDSRARWRRARPLADAPVTGPRGDWLLQHLGGGFDLLVFGDGVSAHAARDLARDPVPCRIVQVGGVARDDRVVIQDKDGLLAARYDARRGIRATWSGRTSTSARAGGRSMPRPCARAVARATGNGEGEAKWAH